MSNYQQVWRAKGKGELIFDESLRVRGKNKIYTQSARKEEEGGGNKEECGRKFAKKNILTLIFRHSAE